MHFRMLTTSITWATSQANDTVGSDAEFLGNSTRPEVTFRYVGITIGIIDIVLGTFGNLLTIVSFMKSRALRSNVFNHFIVNLAFIDLLTASCMMPFNVAGYIYMQWPFGNDHVTCAIQAFFYFCCGYTSVVCFLAITLNRFVGIVYPERYVSVYSTNWGKFILALTWIVAPAFLFPSLITSAINNAHGYPKTPTGWKEREFLCTYVNVNNWVIYMQVSRVIFQFLPLIIMIFAYVVIWYKVKQSDKRLFLNTGCKEYRERIESSRDEKTIISNASPRSSPAHVAQETRDLRKLIHLKNVESNGNFKTQGLIYDDPKNPAIHCNGMDERTKDISPTASSSSIARRRSVGQNQRLQRQKRLIYVSIIIWSTFTVLFLPSLIINLLPNRSELSPTVHMLASNITWLNSCVNPIIYVVVHKSMRREYYKILETIFRRSSYGNYR